MVRKNMGRRKRPAAEAGHKGEAHYPAHLTSDKFYFAATSGIDTTGDSTITANASPWYAA